MSVRTRKNGVVALHEENEPCNFSDEVEIKEEHKKRDEKPLVEVNLDIPNKYFMTQNLKTILPDYAEKRREIKNNKHLAYWEIEINNLLSLYDGKNDHYHFKLCRCVLQILEDYCIWNSRLGACKKHIAKNILLKFFDNNEDLLDAVIENELEHIIRSTLLRRLFARAEMLFFSKNY